jgi:predicted secreted hydrolase
MKALGHFMRRAVAALGMLLCAAGAAHGDGWARALAPRDWVFPRDHGVHADYKTEWWYFTGNVADAEGRRFGYQLTFFRQGLAPELKLTRSAWAVKDVYFAHFTITDTAGGRFHFAEQAGRGVRDMAGASSERMEVWIDGWRVETTGPETYRLSASSEGMTLDLTVAAEKPPVLQGEKGLSQKAAAPGNASNYYSYTRLETRGSIGLGGDRFEVAGTSWFDHEFSTSSLAGDQVGWDWFSIQLGNGEELMLYRMRRKDGSADPFSNGTLVGKDGAQTHLGPDDFRIMPKGTWKSPKTGAIYPSGWEIGLPRLETVLQVVPQLKDQELTLEQIGKLSYWEGSCRIEGMRKGVPVSGWGYTELTGYDKPVGGELK